MLLLAAALSTAAQDAAAPSTTSSAPQAGVLGGVMAKSADASASDEATPLRVVETVQSANIIHQVVPEYPLVAKTAHISGTVLLHAIIGTDGSVEELSFISGPPLLLKSSMDAVKQWQYRPTLVNGKPVKVDTTVSVVYTLGDNPYGAPIPSNTGQQQSKASNGTSTPPAPPAAAIDPQFRADILHLIEVTHANTRGEESMRKGCESLRPMLMQSMPPTPSHDRIVQSYIDACTALPKSQEFVDAGVTIIAAHLTPEDVKAAIKFYDTPEGQHYLQGTQNMAGELMPAWQRLGVQKAPAILNDLCKQYPELNDESKFCPVPNTAPAAPSAN